MGLGGGNNLAETATERQRCTHVRELMVIKGGCGLSGSPVQLVRASILSKVGLWTVNQRKDLTVFVDNPEDSCDVLALFPTPPIKRFVGQWAAVGGAEG